MMEREALAEKDYLRADSILYLGEAMPLRWVKADHPLKFYMGAEGFVLRGMGTSDQAKALIEGAYRDRARTIFQKRAAQFAKALDVQPNQIRIKAQKTRWGSCSSKGNLNFNWHAIVAPPEVVDYLVVHEVCHLVHMNHSTAFWDLVASIRPNYREERDWLKKHDTQILP
jgi:hypothetical protein